MAEQAAMSSKKRPAACLRNRVRRTNGLAVCRVSRIGPGKTGETPVLTLNTAAGVEARKPVSATLHYGLILRAAFAGLLHKFPLDSLLFPVQNDRRLFVILPFFKFPYDAFLFHHTLETFDGFFQKLVVIYHDVGQK
jgi:hypothetical protein